MVNAINNTNRRPFGIIIVVTWIFVSLFSKVHGASRLDKIIENPESHVSANAKTDQITRLSAQVNNESVSIRWSISEIESTSYFNVERSKDAVKWKQIARLTADVTPVDSEFSYIDNDPYEGNSYYRIIEVKKDDCAIASDVVAVYFNSK